MDWHLILRIAACIVVVAWLNLTFKLEMRVAKLEGAMYILSDGKYDVDSFSN